MPRLLTADVRCFGRYTDPLVLNLADRGLVLVEGENRDAGDAYSSNGSGKSMLFEAITWCLTSKMARYEDRRIGPDEVAYGERGADVAVHFTTTRGEFLVRRAYERHGKRATPALTISPVVNGAVGTPLTGTGVHAADADTDLTSLLGFDHRTLRHAIFIQGAGLDIAESTFARQMAVLESILRFDEFTRARERAKRHADALNAQVQNDLAALEGWSRHAENARHALHELEALDETERESEIISRVRVITRETKRISDIERTVESLKQSHDEAVKAQTEAKTLADVAAKRLVRSRTLLGAAECPTCRRELDVEQTDVVIAADEAALEEARAVIPSLEQSVAARFAGWTERSTELRRLQDLQREEHQLRRELDLLRERADKRLHAIQIQQTALDAAEANIAQFTTAIGDARRTLAIAQGWSKRDFEAVKAEVMSLAAPVFNDAADRYGAVLSDGAQRVELVTVRESRNESLLRFWNQGRPCDYASFSDGEKRRVNLTAAFAFRECARWRMAEPINVCVYDEVFDKLDEAGLDRVLEVLERDLSEIESVFAITHSPALKARLPSARTIRVIREHGISRTIL